MTDTKKEQIAIISTWTRISQEPCAQLYPETLEFREDGVYLTSSSDDTFREWQAGDYKIQDKSFLKMQLSNDAMGLYHFSFQGSERLVFEDSNGCRITYGKMEK